MCRAPGESFQTVRKSHILSLLEVKPEFTSDISDTKKPAWQHSLARNILSFSKDRNQLRRHSSSWSELLGCPWEAQLLPRCSPECPAGKLSAGAGAMGREKDLPWLDSLKQQQTQSSEESEAAETTPSCSSPLFQIKGIMGFSAPDRFSQSPGQRSDGVNRTRFSKAVNTIYGCCSLQCSGHETLSKAHVPFSYLEISPFGNI